MMFEKMKDALSMKDDESHGIHKNEMRMKRKNEKEEDEDEKGEGKEGGRRKKGRRSFFMYKVRVSILLFLL